MMLHLKWGNPNFSCIRGFYKETACEMWELDKISVINRHENSNCDVIIYLECKNGFE